MCVNPFSGTGAGFAGVRSAVVPHVRWDADKL